MWSLYLVLLLLATLLASCMIVASSSSQQSKYKNFILVIADDLRPDLHLAYGKGQAVTPNFDEFASRHASVVLDRVYSNYPMCGPSRSSFMFGRLPTETQVYTNEYTDESISQRNKLNPSLPKFLQSKGYFTATGGKVFHEAGINGDNCWNLTYDATTRQQTSWCQHDKKASSLKYPGTSNTVSPQICITVGSLQALPDIRVATHAVETLKHIKSRNLFPFFLAAGFYKPHVPLQIHAEFFRMVPSTVADAENPQPPEPIEAYPVPALSFAQDANLVWGVKQSKIDLTPYGKSPQIFRTQVRKAYMAAVAQTDYAFGMLLAGLDDLDLTTSTMVIFMSDHSYSLGENNLWGKDALFEMALRVPMIVSVPWINGKHHHIRVQEVSRMASTFMELIDVYPTAASLLGLSGLPIELDGIDQSSVVTYNIQYGHDLPLASVEGMAFSMVARCAWFETCTHQHVDVTALGFSVRTEIYRYTAWMKTDLNELKPEVNWSNPSSLLAEELYKHDDDDNSIFNYAGGEASYYTEFENIAPGSIAKCSELFRIVREHFSPSRR